MKRTPEVVRSRLRIVRPAEAGGGAWDPPIYALSPRHVRWLDASGRHELGLASAREEAWVRGEDARLRATLDPGDKLRVVIDRDGAAPIVFERLVRIPGVKAASDPYLGRWEYGALRVVISPKGSGAIHGEGTVTLERAPERCHVYEGEGVLVALRDVPNGARVVCAEGVPGLAADALVSDVRVPDLERGPLVEVHPNEAFLHGFAPVGLRASFGGLDFAAFAVAQGDGSPDLARFTKRQYGVAWGALAPIAPPADADEALRARLARELAPSALTGRVRPGEPGTIALTDGRRYRVLAAAREVLPEGRVELVACLLLDDVLLATVVADGVALEPPDAHAVLRRLEAFLLGLHAVPGT
ncbi:MAG: hypothetical protein KF729_32235 [Sandaracinaceae bacterium]|nr:hypothetical protein [Sandaracinaceae bacterium]